MIERKEIQSDYIDDMGYYIIENYDKKPSFASFLSGIAGVEGIPMWSYYVNRGQALSSMGIRDKDNCIMEFFPANEAYKMVYSNGYRTFLKIEGNENIVYEPFSMNTSESIKRAMKIKNNELVLVEVNEELGIEIEITYFTIPNEEFAAMSRAVKVTNRSNNVMSVELLDGLAAILPYGSTNSAYKEVGNTLRSWMEGEIQEDNTAIYKVRSSTGDTTKVDKIENGYFYVAFDEMGNVLKPIVDPENIFGYDTSLRIPVEFNSNSIELLLNQDYKCYNKVPCAFSGRRVILEENSSSYLYSYIGYMNDSKYINKVINKICNEKYFNIKLKETNSIIQDINKHVETKTAYPLFDEYIKQCYIDNVLRGGYPLELGEEDKKIYYVYSRKHGDLERDYNFFSIEPNFYSQGNGNFRDINQNRRMDVYIHPFTGKENIKLFSDLIQLDGYNPLVIKGKKFSVEEKEKLQILKSLNSKDTHDLESVLNSGFTIGELYSKLKNIKNIEINGVLNKIIDVSKENVEADFGEGFWTDHWTYNLDLIEEYLNIYPDKVQDLLIEDKSYKFFNSPEFVLPRKNKYVLDGESVRQYISLEKKRENLESWIYDLNGNLYKTNLFVKLFILATIKFATLDARGFGIEMEAGKPGWNDAMNGLPGLLGSSLAETAELKRLLLFVNDNISVVNEGIELPIEFYDLLSNLKELLKGNLSDELSQFEYWDKVSDIREDYREKIKYSLVGDNVNFSMAELKEIVEDMIAKVNVGLEEVRALNNDKIPTFIYYDVTKYEVYDEGCIKPLEFKVNFLPLFLEGPTRLFKTDLNQGEKENLYNTIKESEVYDKALKMYKTSESLEDVSFEIGRSRSFTAGWLERESIFMHMEYKYILELIKNGLYDQFFNEVKNIMPPFMDPKTYGRSILENSSFIASSANPDKRNHGKGFIARLSGTTVEMLNIWKLMMVGESLFKYEDGILKFKLNPILSKDFFVDGSVITTLLGKIKLVYENPNNKDTFGFNKGEINEIIICDQNENIVKLESNEVVGELAEAIRRGQVKEIRAKIV